MGEKDFKVLCRCAPWAAQRSNGWRVKDLKSNETYKNDPEKEKSKIMEEQHEYESEHKLISEVHLNEVGNIDSTEKTKRKPTECKDVESTLFIDEAVQQIPLDKRNNFGYLCKWLIDYGRVQYIKSHLNMKNAKTVRYIEDSISPENHLILASSPSFEKI